MSLSEAIEVDAVVVGAGISGICMGVHLGRIGASYVVIERRDGVGGTWRANTYPGAACDTESHHYSFSFARKPDWSRVFSPQPEILDYLETTAASLGVLDHCRFGVAVTGASWDERAGRWAIETSDGQLYSCRAFISAVGQLNEPAIPQIPGLDEFDGTAFHTAEWDHGAGLSGKRVGVIGTAASGLQVIPPLSERVEELVVFQRSANWVFPKNDREYTDREKQKYRGWRGRLYRWRIYWAWERWWPAFIRGSKAAAAREAENRAWIAGEVADSELADTLTPTYEIGCKRVLIADNFYPALQRSNVRVVASPIERATGTGLVAGDHEFELDAIVLATGFKARDFLASMDVLGRRGRRLHEAWGDSPEAHLGITVPGFPNFFMLYGPNTNLGHNSIIFMIESQARYIRKAVRKLIRGVHALEVTESAAASYDRDLRADLAKTAWAGSCKSWYKNADGRIVNNWSGRTYTYWWKTRFFRRGHYDVRKQPA